VVVEGSQPFKGDGTNEPRVSRAGSGFEALPEGANAGWCAPCKCGAFQWVQVPPRNRSRRQHLVNLTAYKKKKSGWNLVWIVLLGPHDAIVTNEKLLRRTASATIRGVKYREDATNKFENQIYLIIMFQSPPLTSAGGGRPIGSAAAALPLADLAGTPGVRPPRRVSFSPHLKPGAP